MNVYSKLALAVVGVSAISMSAQAQTQIGESAELMFSKSSIVEVAQPKCGITTNIDEMPMKYNPEEVPERERFYHLESDLSESLVLSLDLVEVDVVRMFTDKTITEVEPVDGTSVIHDVVGLAILLDMGKYGDTNISGVIRNDGVRFTQSQLEYYDSMTVKFPKPTTGTGDLHLTDIDFVLGTDADVKGSISDTSDITGYVYVACYST